MRENRLDTITDLVKDRLNSAVSEAKKQFQGTNPYRKEPISEKEQIYNYETRGYDIFKEIADTQGIEAAIIWQQKMEEMKARRMQNA